VQNLSENSIQTEDLKRSVSKQKHIFSGIMLWFQSRSVSSS